MIVSLCIVGRSLRAQGPQPVQGRRGDPASHQGIFRQEEDWSLTRKAGGERSAAERQTGAEEGAKQSVLYSK